MTKYNLPIDMNPDALARLVTWAVAVADIIINAPGDRKLRLGDLAPAGVHYVADYGVAQSMTDVHSGMAKKVKDAAELALAETKPDNKPWFKLVAESGMPTDTLPADDATIEAVANGVINARQTKRFDAIVASALAVREVTGRLSTRDAWVAKTALDEIRAKHDAVGREMPKGAALKEITAKYAAHPVNAERLAKLWAEHTARLATTAATTDEILGF